MGKLLQTLRRSSQCHVVEPAEEGFVIARRSPEYREAFNRLVSDAINLSGADYVALPRTDGQCGYDQAIIIPIE